jgi:polar amino acid transport system substrate-binding protein
MRIPRVARIAVVAALAGTALTACAVSKSSTASPATSASPSANACTPAALATKVPGKLTIGADNPVYEPWFVGNKPENGQGFESAVAYAVAKQLGYAQSDVTWTRVTFNNAIQPGPKAFDFDIDEFSITADRRKAVDFSSPYYDVTQAIVALKSSKIAGVTTLAGLKDAKLGAQVGTTSYQAITEIVKPSAQPAVYNSNDDAVKALQNGSIDGLVVDLPTAFYITSAQVDNSTIVGQLPQPSGQPEQFGLVLDNGSSLTVCVSQAVDALRTAGTLTQLTDQWLAQVAKAPELQ